MAVSYEGGCHCGRVRYTATAEPVVAGHCQCTDCQKLSGAGHASLMAFPEAAVTITGEVTTYDHPADSGASVTTGFCPTCGTPIFGKTTGMPGTIALRATGLDDPSVFRAQFVVFSRSAQPWDRVDPDVPAFEAMPPR